MVTPTQEGELFTAPELARFLGVSQSIVYLWRRKGQGPPWFKIPNGHVRYWRSDVLQWMHQEDREPAA